MPGKKSMRKRPDSTRPHEMPPEGIGVSPKDTPESGQEDTPTEEAPMLLSPLSDGRQPTLSETVGETPDPQRDREPTIGITDTRLNTTDTRLNTTDTNTTVL